MKWQADVCTVVQQLTSWFLSCGSDIMNCEIKTVINLCSITTNEASKHLKLFKQSFEAFTGFSNETLNSKISIYPSPT